MECGRNRPASPAPFPDAAVRMEAILGPTLVTRDGSVGVDRLACVLRSLERTARRAQREKEARRPRRLISDPSRALRLLPAPPMASSVRATRTRAIDCILVALFFIAGASMSVAPAHHWPSQAPSSALGFESNRIFRASSASTTAPRGMPRLTRAGAVVLLGDMVHELHGVHAAPGGVLCAAPRAQEL